MSIFTILKKSLFQIEEYKNLIKISNLKLYMYILLLSIFLSLYLFYNLSSFFLNFNDEVNEFIKNKVPNFTIENGKLNIEKNIDYSFFNNSIKVIVNTSENVSISDFPSYPDVVLVTNEKIFAKSFNIVEEINISTVADKLNIYSKEDLINNKSLIKNILLSFSYVLIPTCLIISHISLFLIIIILSLLVILMQNFRKIQLKYNEILKFTTFAYTMPFLFLIILRSIGVYVPTLIYISIFYVIAHLGLKDIEKYTKEV